MKKHSRVFTLLSLLILLALCVTACNSGSSKDPTPTPANPSGNTAQPSADNTGKEGDAVVEAPAPDPYSPMPEMVTFHVGTTVPAEPKYPDGESVENNDVLTWFQDNMNIDIKYDWIVSDQNNAFRDKINLLIASNDLPDFFCLRSEDMHMFKKMINSDMLMDLTQVYNDYISPTFKEMHEASDNVAFQTVTFDGKLMAIPGLSDMETAAAVIWYRADWLEQAGLQPPQNADDVFNTVKVFKEMGLASSGVLPARGDGDLLNGDTATFDWLFSYYNAYPGMWITGPDGKVTWGSIQPEIKDGLAKAAEMYKAGLLPSDFALWDGNKAVELVAGNQVGIFAGAWWSTWWPMQDSVRNDPEAVWKAVILQSEDGQYHQRGYPPSGNYLMIRKGVENPEAIVKMININEDNNLKKNDWYNELKNDEGSKYQGVFGRLMPDFPGAKYLDEISRKYFAIMDVLSNPDKKSQYDAETSVLADTVKRDIDNPGADINDWASASSWIDGVGAFAGKGMKQTIPAFVGATDTYEKNRSILIDLEKSTFLKIIMGEAPLDDFDKFVQDWLSLGGEQTLNEINEIMSK